MSATDKPNSGENFSLPVESVETSPFEGFFTWRWEMAFYVSLVVISLLMRFWDLGSRAMGYDESLHGYYSFRLAEGLGYEHSPLMHGPFQFHGVAFMFFLFGDSDAVARLLPALFGTVIVFLPYFLRDRLGVYGALVASTLLAFSPMMLFYSRYARNDILMAVWVFGIVILMWRYFSEGRSIHIYLTSLLLALALATKETAFITIAILGAYLVIVSAPDWIPWLMRRARRLRTNIAGNPSCEYGYIAGYGYGYSLGRRPVSLADFSRPGAFLILLGTLVLPQLSAMVSLIPVDLIGHGVVLASTSAPVGAPSGDILFTLQGFGITKGIALALIVVFLAVWFSVLAGTTWSRRVWLRSAAVFYITWLLLYTTFLTNMVGIGSGVWQSLGYWIVQHDVSRGGQPWYYYFVVGPIYETIPFLLSAVAVVYYLIRGNSFTRFLSYWVVSTLFLYSLAGEKMPWLLVNIALPMIVLAGKFIGDILEATDWSKVYKSGGFFLFLLTPIVLYLLVKILLWDVEIGSFINFSEFWILAFAALIAVGLGFKVMVKSGLENGLRMVVVSLAIALFVLAFRIGWQASYENGDVPKEMIVYAQDSGEVLDIMASVYDVAEKTGEGDDIHITVDKDIYWGLIWYLREFQNIDYVDIASIDGKPEGSILLISSGNQSKVSQYVEQYELGRDFLYLWWPGEGYKPCGHTNGEPCLSWGEFASNIVSRQKWREVLDYYIYRNTDVPFMYHRAVAYFPLDY